ncbi:MAG: thiamine phosphate synthase [Polyangiaceae bacterium]|nr:thiamine phosphate synthase [Polyangiaceae bacterium]
MRGLYAIIDTDALSGRGIEPVAFAEAILGARPAAIQLRDKRGGAGRTLALLRAIGPLARRAGVPLFANDRPDLAVLAGCEGVHVGQEDLPVPAVRELCARTKAALRVGVSTHSRGQIDDAVTQAIDYVAIGPIFPTSSKERPDAVVGLEALGALAAVVGRARPGLPVVAIGGISIETAAAVGARCDCAAVIGALLPREGARGAEALEEAAERARALHAAIVGAATISGAGAA